MQGGDDKSATTTETDDATPPRGISGVKGDVSGGGHQERLKRLSSQNRLQPNEEDSVHEAWSSCEDEQEDGFVTSTTNLTDSTIATSTSPATIRENTTSSSQSISDDLISTTTSDCHYINDDEEDDEAFTCDSGTSPTSWQLTHQWRTDDSDIEHCHTTFVTPVTSITSDDLYSDAEANMNRKTITDNNKSAYIKQNVLLRCEALCGDDSGSGSPPIIVSYDLDEDTMTSSGDARPRLVSNSIITKTTDDEGAIYIANTICNLRLSPSPIQSSAKKLGRDHSEEEMDSHNHTPSISRDNSTETYTDSTGVDLEEFIKKTLNKNPKDRQMLYGLENDLTDFINDNGTTRNARPLLKFPAMTSYHRMLVHRVAAFFGLEHNVDQTGKCIVVNKTANTRIPDFKFKEQSDIDGADVSQPDSDEPRAKRILQRERDCISTDEINTERDSLECMKKSKSLEERQEQYVIARNRIFDEKRDSQNIEQQQNFPVGRISHNSGGTQRFLFSNEVHNWTEPRPWSSTDSSGYGTDAGSSAKSGHRQNSSANANLTKANSFHSMSMIPQRKINDIGNANSMDRSLMSRPSLIVSTPVDGQTVNQSTVNNDSIVGVYNNDASLANDHGLRLPIWVASTFDMIPTGSLIINPNTGAPFLNSEGMPYKWQGQMMPQIAPINTYMSGQSNTHLFQEESHGQYPLSAQSSTESNTDLPYTQHQHQQHQHQLNNQILMHHQMGAASHGLTNTVYLPNQVPPMSGNTFNGAYQAYTQNTGVTAGPTSTLSQPLTQANTIINPHLNNGTFIANENGGQPINSMDGQQYPVNFDPGQFGSMAAVANAAGQVNAAIAISAGQQQQQQSVTPGQAAPPLTYHQYSPYLDHVSMMYSRNAQQQQHQIHQKSDQQNFANNNAQQFPRAVQYYQLPPNYMQSSVQQNNSQLSSNYHPSPNRAANQCPPVSISPQLTSTPPSGHTKASSSPIRSSPSCQQAPTTTTVSSTTSSKPVPLKSPYRQRPCNNDMNSTQQQQHRTTSSPSSAVTCSGECTSSFSNAPLPSQQQQRNSYHGQQCHRVNGGKNQSRGQRIRKTHSKETSSPQTSIDKDDNDTASSNSGHQSVLLPSLT